MTPFRLVKMSVRKSQTLMYYPLLLCSFAGIMAKWVLQSHIGMKIKKVAEMQNELFVLPSKKFWNLI